MDTHDPESLHLRVLRLEQTIEEIKSMLAGRGPAQTTPPPTPTPTPPPPPPQHRATPPAPTLTAARPRKEFTLPAHMRKGEYWLSRAGIGLLLFGVVFLFKYSIEQGWITPWTRVAFGVVVGGVLMYFGLKLYFTKKWFATVLLGGGIATWYITGFAAFQLLELITQTTAYGFMIAVTLAAFVVSLRQNEAVLSLIGAAGGFGTPFLLYTGSGNIPGLMTYTVILLAGTSAIYFFKGWKSLLWLSTIGGWIIMTIGLEALPARTEAALADRKAVQTGIAFCWLAFWGLPLWREVFWIKNSDRWVQSSIGFGDKSLSDATREFLGKHVHLLTVVIPSVTLLTSMAVWPWLTKEAWGFIGIGLTVCYGALFTALRKIPQLNKLAFTHAFSAVLLLAISTALLLDGSALLIAISTEMMLLHLVTRGIDDNRFSVGAHILFFILVFWMAVRFEETPSEGVVAFSPRALSNIWVLIAAGAASYFLKPAGLRTVYRIAAHLGALAWLAAELSRLPNGQGWVSVAWGVYAAILLILGLRLDIHRLRITALATLGLLVAKLFFIDLDRLETIWRVLLFIGFGGVFLLLSYYFKDLWSNKSQPSPNKETPIE